jgi:hypothetical protein
MSNITLDIMPKEGLGEIKFGEIPENLANLVGEPDSVEEIISDDDLKTTILTFENGVTIFLEGLVEPIVSNFDIDNKNAKLFGVNIFELGQEQVTALMKEHGYIELEVEEEEWGETRLTFDDAIMDFYFEDGDLTAVNWGVLINDDGKIER